MTNSVHSFKMTAPEYVSLPDIVEKRYHDLLFDKIQMESFLEDTNNRASSTTQIYQENVRKQLNDVNAKFIELEVMIEDKCGKDVLKQLWRSTMDMILMDQKP